MANRLELFRGISQAIANSYDGSKHKMVRFDHEWSRPVLTKKASVGNRVAIIGAGGIGFDVAQFLVSEGKSSTLNLDEWLKEWGVADPEEFRGGLAPNGPEVVEPLRQVSLFQRKNERLGNIID